MFDMGIHQFSKPRGVDRILVDRVEFRQDAAQHCPHHVGRQPRDPVSLQELLRQCRLTHPGRTADEVEDTAGHGDIVATGTEGCRPIGEGAIAATRRPHGAGTTVPAGH